MTDWNRMPEFTRHYDAPWDCSKVLVYVVSPATGEGHVYPVRWAIPYEGAGYDPCWWETNLSARPGSSPVVKQFVTHWAPWPEPPADAEEATQELVARFKAENEELLARTRARRET